MSASLRLATAHVDYQSKAGQVVYNITVKSGKGAGVVLAPTWDMVWNSKNRRWTWLQYRDAYRSLVSERFEQDRSMFYEIMAQIDVVVLCCYCQDTHDSTQHCHRYLAVDWLLEKSKWYSFLNAEYLGEVK